jgi:hypothetical protein
MEYGLESGVKTPKIKQNKICNIYALYWIRCVFTQLTVLYPINHLLELAFIFLILDLLARNFFLCGTT